MPSAFIPSTRGYPAVRLAPQLEHQRCVPPSPLVLGRKPRKFPPPTADRDRPVSRRSEPSSRTTFIGEQPNPWELLHPQDVMSRHRTRSMLSHGVDYIIILRRAVAGQPAWPRSEPQESAYCPRPKPTLKKGSRPKPLLSDQSLQGHHGRVTHRLPDVPSITSRRPASQCEACKSLSVRLPTVLPGNEPVAWIALTGPPL